MVPGKLADRSLGERNFYWFWRRVRDAAGIVADERLRDLCQSLASHVATNGQSLRVPGRQLGRRQASTINRYVHLDDASLSQAAERVALAVQWKLHIRSVCGDFELEGIGEINAPCHEWHRQNDERKDQNGGRQDW